MWVQRDSFSVLPNLLRLRTNDDTHVCNIHLESNYNVMRNKSYSAGMAVVLSAVSLQTWSADVRWTAWSARPATRWEDAFVTGNGSIGTMVMGTPSTEHITCVHEELFLRGWDHHLKTVPQTASLMPEVRRLIEEGQCNEASALIADEADRQLVDMGARQRWPLIPHPAFDLVIRYADDMPHSYASLLEAHAALHSRLFNRMTLDLGCARLWRL